MKIVVAADSAGKPLLDIVAAHLASKSDITLIDASQAPDGEAGLYSEISDRAAQKILSGECERGILVCGTGIGVCISANKVPGIRAALTHDTYSAERAAKSNNAQIITMGARVIGSELAKAIVDTWLKSDFDPQGASAKNVAGIDALDEKYSKIG